MNYFVTQRDEPHAITLISCVVITLYLLELDVEDDDNNIKNNDKWYTHIEYINSYINTTATITTATTTTTSTGGGGVDGRKTRVACASVGGDWWRRVGERGGRRHIEIHV